MDVMVVHGQLRHLVPALDVALDKVKLNPLREGFEFKVMDIQGKASNVFQPMHHGGDVSQLIFQPLKKIVVLFHDDGLQWRGGDPILSCGQFRPMRVELLTG